MRLTNATPQLHALGDHIICISDFLSNNTGLTFAKYQSNTRTTTLATGLDANNRLNLSNGQEASNVLLTLLYWRSK